MNKLLLLALILIMTLLGSYGGFFFKKSATDHTILEIIKNKYLYIGILFYLSGAFINILVLKYMPYSVVLPLSSITYVWSVISAVLILKEKLTVTKVLGISSIVIGAVFIGLC